MSWYFKEVLSSTTSEIIVAHEAATAGWFGLMELVSRQIAAVAMPYINASWGTTVQLAIDCLRLLFTLDDYRQRSRESEMKQTMTKP